MMHDNRWARLHWLLWVPPLVGLAVLAGLTLWLAGRALTYPYQFLHGEGLMLEFTRRLAAGEPVYKPLAEYPLGTCNYAPLPLLLARLTLPLTGLSFTAGRVWTLLATLVIAAILFAWVRRASGQVLPALVAALAWLGTPYLYHWVPQFRVDLPGLAFSLTGIYLVWREVGKEFGPRWPGVVGAALLFVLGLYCKQSFLAAPAAAFCYLLLRHRRQALILAGAMLVLGGVPFLVLNITTHGAFWDSLITSNVNPFDLHLLVSQAVDLVRTYLPLLLLAALFLLLPPCSATAERLPARTGNSTWLPASAGKALIAIYLALALLTVGLAGKVGSWENYFLELLAALCLGAGLGVASLLSLADRAGKALAVGRWVVPLLVLSQVVLMWHTPAKAAGVMRADAAANQVLQPQVAAASGLVLSEDMGLLVQAGKPVPYYDFQLSQLALAGRWDQSWEVGNLQRSAFSLVILETDTRLDVEKYGRYTRAFVSALDYGYRLAERVGKYHVYRPAPLGRDRRVSMSGGLALVGYTLPPAEIQPGQVITLEVVWQATRPMTETYTSFLHLVDAAGRRTTGDDRQAWDGLYPTSRWAGGEMVRMAYSLTLPADLPPGLYTLHAGWYDPALNRLHTETGTGSVPLAVVRAPLPHPQPAGMTPLGATYAEGVRLTGYRLAREAEKLQVALEWQTDHFLDADYTVFLHLQNAAGEMVAQGDGPPVNGQWPTSLWSPGVAVQDTHTIALPPGSAPGTYRLVVGLYDLVTGRRLPLAAGGDAATLAEITLP
jgi:hypothetical protein